MPLNRSMLGERRKIFLEEEDGDVTMREACAAGRDALRELYHGEARMERCAKVLDKRAMQLRAREEATIRLPSVCLCGNTKRNEEEFCTGCFSAIPVGMWMRFHAAKVGEMAEAKGEIREFVRSRRAIAIEDAAEGGRGGRHKPPTPKPSPASPRAAARKSSLSPGLSSLSPYRAAGGAARDVDEGSAPAAGNRGRNSR